MCADPDVMFNPARLGFIPHDFWPNEDVTFGDLVSDYFQRKNTSTSRFAHKLFNALRISDEDPFYSDFLGVEWVGDRVLKVDKRIFARLLGVRAIDGYLFHQQGNFPSHGFVELSETDARQSLPAEELEGVDYEIVRLLVHQKGIFVRGCSDKVFRQCRWTGVSE
jgi:hypothetical protein